MCVQAAESEECPGFSESLKVGRPTYVTPKPSLADGLAVPLVGANSFATAKDKVDKCLAIRWVELEEGQVRWVEPGEGQFRGWRRGRSGGWSWGRGRSGGWSWGRGWRRGRSDRGVHIETALMRMSACVCSESDIAIAILRLVEMEKIVVEGAGATGLAACMSGQLDHLKGKT